MWEIDENRHFHKLVYPRLIYVMAVLNRGKIMFQTILISELVRQYEVKKKSMAKSRPAARIAETQATVSTHLLKIISNHTTRPFQSWMYQPGV